MKMSTVRKSFIAGITGMLVLTGAQPVALGAQGVPWNGLKVPQLAPVFSLKLINRADTVISTDVFSEKELTLLIFWDSYCPDCLKVVAQCQTFHEKSDSVSVLSINFDKENLAGVRALIKGERITFPVLSDPQGTVAAEYQAEDYDFSFFIIDKKGIIRYICYDKPPDVIELITMQLKEILKESPSCKSSEGDSDSLAVSIPQDEGSGEE